MGEGLWDPLKMGSERKRKHNVFPATDLGIRPGGLDLRHNRDVGLPSTYLSCDKWLLD